MSLLLRASFHGLRSSRLISSPSLSYSRELLKPPLEPMKPPKSSHILWRWYGESVAVEESCSATQTVSETAGETKTVLQAEVSSVEAVDAQKPFKETPTANGDKQESAAKEVSSTDELSSLIIERLRNKNSVNAPKHNGSPSQTGPTSLKADKLAEGGDGESTSSKANKLPDGGFQPIKEDKWSQVMNSMRDMAAKKKTNMASRSAMPSLASSREDTSQDDFADLDLPQARNEAVASKLSIKSDSSSRPAMDALREFKPYVKPKEGQMQGVNGKQKFSGSKGFQHRAQDVKPTSFSFLDSLDSSESESDETNTLEKLQKSFSSGLRPARDQKFTKPSAKLDSSLDGEFVKSIDKRSEPMGTPSKPKSDHHDHFKSLQNSSHEAKIASVSSGLSCELDRGNVEKDRDLSLASEAANLLNRSIHPGYTVCVQNLPNQSNLALVKDALSLHGEVVSSFKKPNSSGLCDAFIEFKTAEAMEGALAWQWLSLDSKAFRIVMADAPLTTVVRLSRISADTTDSEVASICEKFGSLDHLHLKRRATGVYDAYYKANELSNMSAILDRLNEVTVNQRRWVALPAPRLLPSLKKDVLKTREGQAWHASQFSEMLNRIETGLEAIAVLFEDLKSLTAMEDEMSKMV